MHTAISAHTRPYTGTYACIHAHIQVHIHIYVVMHTQIQAHIHAVIRTYDAHTEGQIHATIRTQKTGMWRTERIWRGREMRSICAYAGRNLVLS